MPINGAPEPKRRFIPSKHEEQKWVGGAVICVVHGVYGFVPLKHEEQKCEGSAAAALRTFVSCPASSTKHKERGLDRQCAKPIHVCSLDVGVFGLGLGNGLAA